MPASPYFAVWSGRQWRCQGLSLEQEGRKVKYDPQPSRRYLPGYSNGSWEGDGGLRAGVGVILALTDFCRGGAFWVEHLEGQSGRQNGLSLRKAG